MKIGERMDGHIFAKNPGLRWILQLKIKLVCKAYFLKTCEKLTPLFAVHKKKTTSSMNEWMDAQETSSLILIS